MRLTASEINAEAYRRLLGRNNQNPPSTAMPTTEPPAPTNIENQFAELLNQEQMAQKLGVTRRALHNWVRDKVVPMIKIKGFCRFEPAKVYASIMKSGLPAKAKAKAKGKEGSK